MLKHESLRRDKVEIRQRLISQNHHDVIVEAPDSAKIGMCDFSVLIKRSYFILIDLLILFSHQFFMLSDLISSQASKLSLYQTHHVSHTIKGNGKLTVTTGTQTWPDTGRSTSTQTSCLNRDEPVIVLKRNYGASTMKPADKTSFFHYDGESVDQFLIQLRKHKETRMNSVLIVSFSLLLRLQSIFGRLPSGKKV